MDSNPASPLTSDEKLLAAAAHGSVIFLTWGVFIPALIWALGGKKSPRVAFQAVQALAFQLSQAVVMMVVVPALAIIMIVLMMVSAAAAPEQLEPIFLLELGFLAVIFLIFAIYVLLGLIAAAACLFGQNFHYPLLGRWIERYITPPAIPAEAAA